MKKLLALFAITVLGFGFFGGTADATFRTPNPTTTLEDNGGVINMDVLGEWSSQKDALFNIVRGWINWTLGILAFIALIILLYGGFLMVTAAGDDEKYGKWFTILRQAAIGLILIGIAWFVVSLVFFLINLVGGAAVGTDGATAG